MLRTVFAILIVPSLVIVVTNNAGAFQENERVFYSASSAKITDLKEELSIKALPEAERLKRSRCQCSKTNGDDSKIASKVDEICVQKLDEKLNSFAKAFAEEKIRRKSMEDQNSVDEIRVQKLDEKLNSLSEAFAEKEIRRKSMEDQISTINWTMQRNEIQTAENDKKNIDVKGTVNNVSETSQYLTETVAKIPHCVAPVCPSSGRKLKAPSFVSQWFVMKSQDKIFSERIIEHGLNEIPAKVDVQIKNTSGPANGWIFIGDSVVQSDDDTGDEYGGVIYFYNETHILLQAPKMSNNNDSGVLMTTGGQKSRFVNNDYIRFSEGLVRVRAWLLQDFPDTTFDSAWLLLDTTDSKKTFYELSHGLSEYPAFVGVQIRSSGLISEGMGAVMSSPIAWGQSGGVLYGYDEKTVRIWTAYVSTAMRSEKRNSFGQLMGQKDGWGGTGIRRNIKGEVRVIVWSADSFIREKNLHVFAANLQDSEISSKALNNMDIDNDLITFSVQALDGPNRGFLFKGFGSSQATIDPFGGAIFSYNQEGKVRVWRPNETKSGYLIHISQPYGNGTLNQSSNRAAYRVAILKN